MMDKNNAQKTRISIKSQYSRVQSGFTQFKLKLLLEKGYQKRVEQSISSEKWSCSDREKPQVKNAVAMLIDGIYLRYISTERNKGEEVQ
nr:unnamed protein product [Callosobruchus analis]